MDDSQETTAGGRGDDLSGINKVALKKKYNCEKQARYRANKTEAQKTEQKRKDRELSAKNWLNLTDEMREKRRKYMCNYTRKRRTKANHLPSPEEADTTAPPPRLAPSPPEQDVVDHRSEIAYDEDGDSNGDGKGDCDGYGNGDVSTSAATAALASAMVRQNDVLRAANTLLGMMSDGGGSLLENSLTHEQAPYCAPYCPTTATTTITAVSARPASLCAVARLRAGEGGNCGLIVAGDSIVEVETENPEAYACGDHDDDDEVDLHCGGNSTLLVASIQRKRGGHTTREVVVTVRFDGGSKEDNGMCPHLGIQDEDDNDTEKITMLESCSFSGFLTINYSIHSFVKEVFNNLFGNPFRTPWSKGNGIVISADSCYGNPLRINIKRPSYLRQSYGLDINNARPFNRDAFRACYGTGGGLKTLGIPKW